MKWYYYIPEYLPFLFYGPVALLSSINRLQGQTDSMSRIAEAVGLHPWVLIGVFAHMAFLSLLPLGYKWRVGMMGGIVAYGILSSYVTYITTHQLVNTLFGLYFLLVIFVYPVVSAILAVNKLQEEKIARELIERKLDYLSKENDAHRTLLESYKGHAD